MNIRAIGCVLVAMGVMAASAEFSSADKAAVRKAIESATAEFGGAAKLKGKAITVLPVHGDSQGYCEERLIGALVKSGLTCVISNDEKKDLRFKEILKTIKWDERQTTLKSLDAKTIDELGHLKSTQVFLEARIDIARVGRKQRPVVELNLLAYEVSTKQFVWAGDIVQDERGKRWPDVSEVGVKVVFKGGEGMSDLIAAAVRNEIAGYGYRVNGEGKADLLLTVALELEPFDDSGEYFVFKGEAKTRLASCAGDGVLYEKTFDAKGKRGLGERAAAKNLADEITKQVREWLNETLAPKQLFKRHPDFADEVGV